METYDFKNEIIDKNGNKINILDVYNFNKIIFDLEVPVNTLFKIFMKLGFEYFYILYIARYVLE